MLINTFTFSQGLAEEFHWTEKSMQRQAESLKCFPRNYYSATVLKKDGKNQSKTMMGKVADIEVTAIFDCELMFTVRVVWCRAVLYPVIPYHAK